MWILLDADNEHLLWNMFRKCTIGELIVKIGTKNAKNRIKNSICEAYIYFLLKKKTQIWLVNNQIAWKKGYTCDFSNFEHFLPQNLKEVRRSCRPPPVSAPGSRVYMFKRYGYKKNRISSVTFHASLTYITILFKLMKLSLNYIVFILFLKIKSIY